MSTDYYEFLASKRRALVPVGFVDAQAKDLTETYRLFPFQADIVAWALRLGRAAIFADTGLGKTRQELAWGQEVHKRTGGDVLILSPLAVGPQIVREGAKVGVSVTLCRTEEDIRPGLNVTNYDRLHLFDLSAFAGIILNESAILRSYSGAMRNALIERTAGVRFKLAETATPAPNDHEELGNHAEFLGVCSRVEMLATYFTHDGGDTSVWRLGDTSVWRLKGHAQDVFWQWVSTWAVAARKPSDIGPYDDSAYILPELRMKTHVLEEGVAKVVPKDGNLLRLEALTLTDQRQAKRDSLPERVAKMAALVVAEPTEPWLLWCELNAEADALVKAIPGAQQIQGSDTAEEKERRMQGFVEGRLRVLVTKVSIAGYGLNLQNCARQGFVGVTHSHADFYQAVRRSWRFGQTRPVEVHIVYGEREAAIVRNLSRKQKDHERLQEAMVGKMKSAEAVKTAGVGRIALPYQETVKRGRGWEMHLSDCVEGVKNLPADSIHYSLFSPPFASLFTYSDSDRDMGNCKGLPEFMQNFAYLVPELYRVLMPGRLLSFHCMNLPATKETHGYIGIQDFRGELIRQFQAAGFIYHSEVCIWKDPVTAMQRTKALGLLHKQLIKDRAMSRQGLPDYLVTMRKPGDNPERISGALSSYEGETPEPDVDYTDPTDTRNPYSIEVWQRYASPVWFDINQSDTLQRESAREEKDERHICPLQRGVIRRALHLWTNPGDTVLSPFAGIGSEGTESLAMGRRFIGFELKRSYWQQACANLANAEETARQPSLLSDDEE